jgi:hypothetical protein
LKWLAKIADALNGTKQEWAFRKGRVRQRLGTSLRSHPRGELEKQGGNNPGADTNPPEDQEGAVERVEVA